ncbi:uncharacterized protein LOC126987771 isoform X3 [Eriocheir sinensis]|uniref:uncharacterized protein LOC126987771 isoform X3 n=2 Tax=Eriocheir sinensis TaxID=95602 RepID=UPI0021C6FDC3|nr:uncharacterized protein LOC126987771 isoform X3 [Eriocheir sinensis]
MAAKLQGQLRLRLAKFRAEMDTIAWSLLHGEYPLGMTINQKRNLRRQMLSFRVIDGKLYYRKRDCWVEVLTTVEQVNEVMQLHHVTDGKHRGIVNTRKMISAKYYWSNMTEDITGYISTCSTCQSREAAGTHVYFQGQQEQDQQEVPPPMDAVAVPHPMDAVAVPHPMDAVAVPHPMDVVAVDLNEMPEDWSEEDTYKFVMLYKEHECLWNMHGRTFQVRKARQRALNDIRVKMEMNNFGIYDVKQKIRSLRVTLQQELNKVKKSEESGAGTRDVYKPAMKWFPIMKDLMDHGQKRRKSLKKLDKAAEAPEQKNHGIILQALQHKAAEAPEQKKHAILLYTLQDKTANAPEQKNHAMILSGLQDKAAKAPEWKDCGIQNDTESDSTLSAHSPLPADINGNSNPVVSMQQEGSSKPISEIVAALKELKELNKAINNPKLVDDECETFGRHIAAQLKKLNPENCIMAQEDIQQVLTRYRRAELSSNNSGSAPP